MAKPVFEARENEKVFAEKVTADCWKRPGGPISRQVAGKAYFTDQRLVFLAKGLIGTASASWEIELNDIASVEACMIPPFFPFGILITTKDGGRYKLSIMKRKKYIDWLLQHIA